MEAKLGMKVKEHIVLKKFTGDGPDDRTDEPDEVLVIEDGVIIQHIINKQNI